MDKRGMDKWAKELTYVFLVINGSAISGAYYETSRAWVFVIFLFLLVAGSSAFAFRHLFTFGALLRVRGTADHYQRVLIFMMLGTSILLTWVIFPDDSHHEPLFTLSLFSIGVLVWIDQRVKSYHQLLNEQQRKSITHKQKRLSARQQRKH